MTKEITEPEAKQLVVFHLFPGLSYRVRIAAAFMAIFAGLALQFIALHWLPGIILVFGGNLLLLIKGFNNNFKPGKFDAAANWQKVEESRLSEIEEQTVKIKTWDRSFLDISNSRGTLVFIGICVLSMLLINWFDGIMIFKIAGYDILVLVVPQLVTGRRSILLLPDLILKIRVISGLIKNSEIAQMIDGQPIEYFMLLKGDEENKLPSDVKFRIPVTGHHPDFLGFYGQVVINTVSQSYPYFYAVLVAKSGYGLKKAAASHQPPKNCIGEFSDKNGVEVLVIRQRTTSTSGYFTNPKTIRMIFSEGFTLAMKVAIR